MKLYNRTSWGLYVYSESMGVMDDFGNIYIYSVDEVEQMCGYVTSDYQP